MKAYVRTENGRTHEFDVDDWSQVRAEIDGSLVIEGWAIFAPKSWLNVVTSNVVANV